MNIHLARPVSYSRFLNLNLSLTLNPPESKIKIKNRRGDT